MRTTKTLYGKKPLSESGFLDAWSEWRKVAREVDEEKGKVQDLDNKLKVLEKNQKLFSNFVEKAFKTVSIFKSAGIQVSGKYDNDKNKDSLVFTVLVKKMEKPLQYSALRELDLKLYKIFNKNLKVKPYVLPAPSGREKELMIVFET